MDLNYGDANSKVEPWTQEAPGVTPADGIREVDLDEHRTDRGQLSHVSNHNSSQHTSQFTSFFMTGSSRGILEDDDRQRYPSQVTPEQPVSGAASPHAAGSGPGGRISSSSKYEERLSASSFRGNDAEEMSIDDSIPAHCRMDELNPTLSNPNKSRMTPSGAAGFGNAKDANWRSSPRQEIASGRNYFKPETGYPGTEKKSDNPDLSKRKRSKHKSVPRPQQISADVDEVKLKRVEDNLSQFTKKIDAALLLPHLKPCLSHQNYTHIRGQIDVGESPLKVNQLLWKYLKRAPDWWWYLELALDECGWRDLLAIMRD